MMKINLKKTIRLFVLWILFPAALMGQGKKTITRKHLVATSDNQLLPLDPAVRTGKLPNGFTYYIRHNTEPKDRVIFYLVNKVGSILEDDDQRGLAHFMEHMSFNGTKHYPKNRLVDYLQQSGIRFGADLNAYTGFDETVYQLPLPSDKSDIMRNGIQIMRDWAQEATLDPIEIDKERGVVLEEKRLGKGAAERMERQYYPIILNHSRYADRAPIGTDEVLNTFKPEAIRRFYHDWYRPDLQALIVVGDIDVNQMERLIKFKFSDLKNPANEKIRTNYTTALTGKNQFIAVTDGEQVNTEVKVLIKQVASSLKTIGDYRKTVVRQLFNSMLAQRYAELSRQSDPPFINGSATITDLSGDLADFNMSVIAKPGQLETGFKATWREVERLKKYGFTETELIRAKSNILNYIMSVIKEKNKTNSSAYVNEYLAYFLKGTAAPGINSEYILLQKELPEISLTTINALIKTTITANNRDIIVLAPDKDKTGLPDESTFNGWISMVAQEKLMPYQDIMSRNKLLAVIPESGKVISEKRDVRLDITTMMLGNGVKVILKPTDFKNDEILFTAFAPGGTSLYSDTDFQSANNAVTIISANGIGNYDKSELDKFLSGKRLSVSPFITERTQGISGSSNKGNLETAMQLIYADFTQPRKDTAIFNGLMEQSKAAIANRANDPNNVFQDTALAFLGRNNIRRTGPSIAKLEQISLDKAYNIYKERFEDASNFTFIFTGSFNVDNIRPLIEKYLGSLPATHKKEQAKDLHINPPEGQLTKIVYAGTEPKAQVDMIFTGDFDFNEESQLNMQALKEVLEIRLLERLREDESGVYTPGVEVNTLKYPQNRYTIDVFFGCSPLNTDKLIASTLDEINKLKKDGPAQINLDKFKAEDKQTKETQFKTNAFWLGYLSGQLQNQESLEMIVGYPAAMDKVTIQSVKEAAKKYLGGGNFIKLEMLPENSKPDNIKP